MFHDQLVTVWSAPNYCYRCGNIAAILELDEHLTKNFKVFEAAPQEARGAQSKRATPEYFLVSPRTCRAMPAWGRDGRRPRRDGTGMGSPAACATPRSGAPGHHGFMGHGRSFHWRLLPCRSPQ